MYRKTTPLATALFGLKTGISAPFSDDVVKVNDNVWLVRKRIYNKIVVVPMYLHSFRFITPKTVTEAQKFMLQYPNPAVITKISDKLRYYRYKRGLHQIDIAKHLGINSGSYSLYEEYEKDYYAPETIDKIAEFLGVDAYDLLDDYNKFMYDGQGENIKKLRKQLNITQKELADMMNVDLCKVKRWEQNKVRMYKYTYEKLVNLVAEYSNIK